MDIKVNRNNLSIKSPLFLLQKVEEIFEKCIYTMDSNETNEITSEKARSSSLSTATPTKKSEKKSTNKSNSSNKSCLIS